MLLSVRYMHFSDLARILNPSILQIRVLFFRFYALHSPSSLNSHYCASGFFCFSSANLALALNSHYCLSKLHSIIFMHFTGLPLSLDSHYHTFKFYSAVFFHCADLAIIVSSYQCSSKLHSALFCIASTLLVPSTVNFANRSSILLFVCIAQILLSL